MGHAGISGRQGLVGEHWTGERRIGDATDNDVLQDKCGRARRNEGGRSIGKSHRRPVLAPAIPKHIVKLEEHHVPGEDHYSDCKDHNRQLS